MHPLNTLPIGKEQNKICPSEAWFILTANVSAIQILTSQIRNKYVTLVDLCSNLVKHSLQKQPCDVKIRFQFAFAESMNQGLVCEFVSFTS